MGKSWLAKGAARPVFGQPSSDRTLENCPAPAAAREQHHERHAGTQPDRSLQGKIHFVFSFRGMGSPFVGYRVLRRDRRRFKKTAMMPPAAIQMAACIIASFICVCAPLRFTLTFSSLGRGT